MRKVLRVLGCIALMALASCASTHMKQYLGKDIREVVLDSGPPINELDMADGVRAFQFRWGGGAVALPSTTTTVGQVSTTGRASSFSGQSSTIGGGVISSDGCVITYLARFNKPRNAWIVESYRLPKELVC
jgi:hypothetical protein